MKCPHCNSEEFVCAGCGASMVDAFKAAGKIGGAKGGKASGEVKRRSPEHYKRIALMATKKRQENAALRMENG